MKSWHVEFFSGLTIIVQADNIYSALVIAADSKRLSTADIVAVSAFRGGD